MMRIRLRMLLTSFNKSVADYALARLEVALANPGAPAPPIVDRLIPHPRAGEAFTSRWPTALAQAGAAADFVAAGNRGALRIKQDLSWARLARAVKMIVQFAESIEWLGVTTPEDGA